MALPQTDAPLASRPLRDARRVLERLGWGPRPGQVELVAAQGPLRWVQDRLAEDAPPPIPSSLPTVPAWLWARPAKEERKEHRREQHRITRELAALRTLRAASGAHPLHEHMVAFWADHFAVSARKPFTAVFLPDWEATVLRPHALGRFPDLLLATARHPAMLFYLDNWKSVAEGSGRLRRRRRGPERPRGLNENYARELLELHTLGARGGYEQRDVEETARAFTGWSFERGRERPGFVFRAALHDGAPKRVLGERLPGRGREEGEALLRRLALHPTTARRLAHKLAVRFVADDPPTDAVDRTARAFLSSGGELRATLAALLLHGDEPLALAPPRKLKRPFEWVVSALRATDAELSDPRGVLRVLRGLGQVPGLAPSPAGYPDVAERWLDPGALLERSHFAFSLAEGRVPGVELPRVLPVAEHLLPADARAPTREALSDPTLRHHERLALALASPELQLR